MKANRTHGNNRCIDAPLKTPPLTVVQIETIDSPLKSPPLMTLRSFHYRAPFFVYNTSSRQRKLESSCENMQRNGLPLCLISQGDFILPDVRHYSFQTGSPRLSNCCGSTVTDVRPGPVQQGGPWTRGAALALFQISGHHLFSFPPRRSRATITWGPSSEVPRARRSNIKSGRAHVPLAKPSLRFFNLFFLRGYF